MTTETNFMTMPPLWSDELPPDHQPVLDEESRARLVRDLNALNKGPREWPTILPAVIREEKPIETPPCHRT